MVYNIFVIIYLLYYILLTCFFSIANDFRQTVASGRFETMGDILNRNKLLFPLLRRCMEGRALRAVGPPTEEVPTSDGGSRAVITLSGAVAQEVDPPRWPREVCYVFSLFMRFV